MTEREAIEALYALGWSEQSVQLGRRAGFRCEYCGRDLLEDIDAYDAWQVDHIEPRSRGGSENEDNLAVSCKTCNALKRHTPVELPPGASREERLRRYQAQVIAPRRAQKAAKLAEVRTRVGVLTTEPPGDLAGAADRLFRDGLEWLRRAWSRHTFYAERDVVWTLQRWLVGECERRTLPLWVLHGVPMPGEPRRWVDLALVEPRQGAKPAVLAAEFKYEPARGRPDILASKLPVTSRAEILADVERAEGFVRVGHCDIALGVLVDEGDRYGDEPLHPAAAWVHRPREVPRMHVARFAAPRDQANRPS